MSNLIISLLALILHIGLILLFFTLIVSIVYGFLLLINLLIDSENQSSNLTAIIVSIVGILGVMYSSSKARADKEQDRSDNSLFIILQYLIELKNKNYTFKIYREDLSYIFMNVSNDVLFIL